MKFISINKFQKWAIIFGVGSWLSFLVSSNRDFIIKYVLREEIPDPNYAPHNFSYNFEIVFPAIIGAFLFGLLCFGFSVAYLKTQKDDSWSQKLIPFIGVIPTLYLAYAITRFIILICETGC